MPFGARKFRSPRERRRFLVNQAIRRAVPQNNPVFGPHQAKAKPGAFHIEETESWNYRDGVHLERFPWRRVDNAILPEVLGCPHLVLRDASGIPRFVLAFQSNLDGHLSRFPRGILPDVLQRCRTEYAPSNKPDYSFHWSAERENSAQQKFRAALGMHPAEFLFSEFLWRHRGEIKKGVPVLWWKKSVVPSNKPILDRFFSKSAGEWYILDPKKARVKALLG